MFFWAVFFLFWGASAAQTPVPPARTDLTFPDRITFCGRPVPLDDPHVWEMLDREFTIAVHDIPQVIMWLKRAGRYFPFIEKVLEQKNMPDDLKYLAVAESALIYDIRSPRGALGTWQFMPGTGRRYGLAKNRSWDERLDFEKATMAAMDYLSDLHEKFKTWPLAMAAYNCGEKRVEGEMDLQKTDSYFRLVLPNETERYVYRIISAKIILENPEAYGFNIHPRRIYAPVEADEISVDLKTEVPIADFARGLGIDFLQVKILNPHIRGYDLPKGKYRLKVPKGQKQTAEKWIAKLGRRVAVSGPGEKAYYIVRPGDSLSAISKKHGISVLKIMQINRLKTSLIHPGQKLRLQP